MSSNKNDDFVSGKELLADYVCKKTNDALEQAHFWMSEYCRVVEREDNVKIKTVVIHFEGDAVEVDDTDLVNVKIEGSAREYIESLFKQGFHLYSAYPSDVDRTGNNFNLVVRFMRGNR